MDVKRINGVQIVLCRISGLEFQRCLTLAKHIELELRWLISVIYGYAGSVWTLIVKNVVAEPRSKGRRKVEKRNSSEDKAKRIERRKEKM